MSSLSNDYDDGNENDKKIKKTVHVSSFLYISKLSLQDSDMKLPNFMRPLRST